MFSGLAIPFAIETQRDNLVRVPVRNLVASTGDDILLAVQVYEPDGSGTDIGGGAITLTVVSAHQDPGGSWTGCGAGDSYGASWSGAGYDYGRGWSTCHNHIVYQTVADLTDPDCGQAIITIPREVSANWHGRYRVLVSLASEYGGSVQTYGVLDVRRGAQVARLGTAGYVSVSDAVVSLAPVRGLLDGIGVVDKMGLFSRVGVVDDKVVIFGLGRIGVIGTKPATGPQIATFTVTLDAPAQQTAVVQWATVDGTATAPEDYTASDGVLTFPPGTLSRTIVVPVRSYDAGKQGTQFTVHLSAGRGAVMIQADGTATIPGWVGILDDVYLVDGKLVPFVAGLVGVTP